MALKRLLKFLHEIGTVGLMGAAASQLILSHAAEGRAPGAFAAMRHGILLISEWVLLPSLLIVLSSGLFAMAAHRAYQNAGWAWIKAALTVLVLEGTLLSVQAPAQTAVQLADEVAAGETSRAHLIPRVERHERGGCWVILFLSVVNIALAVWRPKLRRRRRSEAGAPELAAGAGRPPDRASLATSSPAAVPDTGE
jgi:hypothetical protein